jgi:hypothetical protein
MVLTKNHEISFKGKIMYKVEIVDNWGFDSESSTPLWFDTLVEANKVAARYKADFWEHDGDKEIYRNESRDTAVIIHTQDVK